MVFGWVWRKRWVWRTAFPMEYGSELRKAFPTVLRKRSY